MVDVLHGPGAAADARRPADFDPLVSYFRSCAASEWTEAASSSTREVVAVLTTQQRLRFARCLHDLAAAALGAARDPGDPLPPPAHVDPPETLIARVEELRREFAASDPGDGARLRILSRLDRELALARDARRRARRCLRLARLLDPVSEEIALAAAFLNAARASGPAARARLAKLARTARARRIRARALLGLASLHVRRGSDRAALHALERSLAIEPRQPEAHARLAYVRLRLGDEPRALASLGRCLRAWPRLRSAADSALAYLAAPASGFPRLLAASTAAAESLRRAHPGFAHRVLEAVQLPARPRARERPGADAFLRSVRRRLRVPFAALVAARSPERLEPLAVSAAARHAITLAETRDRLASGRLAGLLARALDDRILAVVRATPPVKPRTFLRDGARGAAAAALPDLSAPPVCLLVESDRVLAPDPSEFAALASAAVPIALALLARGVAPTTSPG